VFILLLFFSKNFETGKLYTEIVQKRLNEAGITDEEGKPLLEDGIYGEKTKKAHEKAIKIKQFEDENSGVKYGGKTNKDDVSAAFANIKPGEGSYDDVRGTEEWTQVMGATLSSNPGWLASKEGREVQRAFWRTFGKEQLEDCPIAWMLMENSLNDYPKDITTSDFMDKKNIDIQKTITENADFKNALTETMKTIPPEQTSINEQPMNVYFEAYNSKDLHRAFHATNALISGDKNIDGTWNLTVTFYDKYNFDDFYTEISKYSDGFKATVGNNLAFVSQRTGAMNEFETVFTVKANYPN